MGGSQWAQAVMADMAKWGFGEASGARGVLIGLGIFCMLGFCTIVGDGLSGLVVQVLELTSAISSAEDRT